MRSISLLLLLALATSHLVTSYKILVYSSLFGHSHVKFLAAAADALTEAGHDVTVLMPVYDVALRNKTSLKLTKKAIIVEQSETITKTWEEMNSFMADLWVLDEANPMVVWSESESMAFAFEEQCKKVLTEPGLLDKLKAEQFDLAITEPFDTCSYCLFESIQMRAHVAVLTCTRLDHVSKVIGQPAAASYVPGMQSAYGEKMSISERFGNLMQNVITDWFFSYIADRGYWTAQTVVPITRSWRETVPEASFILANQIPLLDFPAPTFDKIVPIGGLSVKTDKKSLKLEEKWSKVLDVRKKNIFISFGSLAKSMDMPESYKKSLIKVFESMPDTTFIWKYENPSDTLVSHLENVHLADWLPQNELLADPRLNVFLTHGGLGSTTELAVMGKPAVMVPLFGDQGRNAQMLKRHGGAEILDKTDLTNSELIQKTLKRVLEDPKYRENAERLAEMLNNQPTNPKETLVKYVEFAARFGKLPSLDNYGRHQTYIEYFFLDIIALVTLFSLTLLYIFYRILKALVTRLCCSKSSKSKKD